jgi:hypothetical protein
MTSAIDDPLGCISFIDAKIAAAGSERARRLLEVLRLRLVGEITGDLDLILASVTDDFHLVSSANGVAGPEQTRDEFQAAMTALCSSGAMTWVSWSRLVADDNGVAGDGLLVYLSPVRDGGQTTAESTVMPLAVFLEYDETAITGEYAYTGNAAPGPAYPCEGMAAQSQALRSQGSLRKS